MSDMTYRFKLGTSEIIGTAHVHEQNGERLIRQVIWTKSSIHNKGQDEDETITHLQAGKVWKATAQHKWTGRTLHQEVERITQATYLSKKVAVEIEADVDAYMRGKK